MPASDVTPSGDGTLPALLRELSHTLHISNEETDRTCKYFESRRYSTLPALATMDTLQWANAQRSAQMTPALFAGLVSAVDKQISRLSHDTAGKVSSFRTGKVSRLCLWVCNEIFFFLALGSWSLLCLLDMLALWPDSAADEKHVSAAIALVVLVVSTFLVASASLWKLDCAKESASLTSITPEETAHKAEPSERLGGDDGRSWALAIHSVLISGNILWLSFHVGGQREHQIWIGMATLYTLVSFAFVDIFAWSRATRDGASWLGKPLPLQDSILEECGSLPPLVVPAMSEPEQQPAETEKVEQCQFVRPANKWKPLFRDPMFGVRKLSALGMAQAYEESLRKHPASKQSHPSSLVSVARPNEMFMEPWQVHSDRNASEEPPTTLASSFGSVLSSGRTPSNSISVASCGEGRKLSQGSVTTQPECGGVGESIAELSLGKEHGNMTIDSSDRQDKTQLHYPTTGAGERNHEAQEEEGLDAPSESAFSDVGESEREEKHASLGSLDSAAIRIEQKMSDAISHSALTDVSSATADNAKTSNMNPLESVALRMERQTSDAMSHSALTDVSIGTEHAKTSDINPPVVQYASDESGLSAASSIRC